MVLGSACRSSRPSPPAPRRSRRRRRVTALAHVHDALEARPRSCPPGRSSDGHPGGAPGVRSRLAWRLEGEPAAAQAIRRRSRSRCRPTRRGPPGCRGRTRGTGPSRGTRSRSRPACTPMPSLGKNMPGSMSRHLPWAIHSLSTGASDATVTIPAAPCDQPVRTPDFFDAPGLATGHGAGTTGGLGTPGDACAGGVCDPAYVGRARIRHPLVWAPDARGRGGRRDRGAGRAPAAQRGHVRVVYLGPVAPHWEVQSTYGEASLIDPFRDRTLARLTLLPPHDPQFRRNPARLVRDAGARTSSSNGTSASPRKRPRPRPRRPPPSEQLRWARPGCSRLATRQPFTCRAR